MVARNSATHRTFRVHLPEALDLSSVTRPAWVAYGEWVVGAITRGQFFAHEPDSFVPLAAEYINLHLPNRVRRQLLGDLTSHFIVECDNTFHFDRTGRVPGKCRYYRLGSPYRGMPIRGKEVTHPELLKKVRHAFTRERELITDPTHRALRAWHDRVQLVGPVPPDPHPLLQVMLDGERRFTVCPMGRVHTNVANLPRECRRHVRLAGRELWAVDIATSQPMTLGLILQACTEGVREAGGKGVRRGRGRTAPFFVHYSGSDLNEYIRDCLDGVVYDRIAEATDYTRDEVKPLFLAVIYGEPRHMETKVGLVIQRLYPSVFRAVVDLAGWLGHGGLPRWMQEVEAGVMIGRVAGRLVREHPRMPVLTVHDSILVPEEHIPLARDIILAEWRAEFGVVPRLKIGRWPGVEFELSG